MRQWRPERELERLLQALEQEILTAEDWELRQVLTAAGLSVGGTRRKVSSVVGLALAEYEDPLAEPQQAATDPRGDHRLRRPH